MYMMIQRLMVARRNINREIRREFAKLQPDTLILNQLKKRRLAIKDRLFGHMPHGAEMHRVVRAAFRRAQRT